MFIKGLTTERFSIEDMISMMLIHNAMQEEQMADEIANAVFVLCRDAFIAKAQKEGLMTLQDWEKHLESHCTEVTK